MTFERVLDRDAVRAAREARKAAERAAKAEATLRVREAPPPVVHPSTHSDDDNALYALLLGRPALCRRLYETVFGDVAPVDGTALMGILICERLFGSTS